MPWLLTAVESDDENVELQAVLSAFPQTTPPEDHSSYTLLRASSSPRRSILMKATTTRDSGELCDGVIEGATASTATRRGSQYQGDETATIGTIGLGRARILMTTTHQLRAADLMDLSSKLVLPSITGSTRTLYYLLVRG
jgi:hypothetical protein